MSWEPLVSIVLPVYNGSRYLPEAVEGCLAQTYTTWELIIVDDASTDSTPAIMSRYQASDRRIRSVRHSANRNLPCALNTGFAEAKGEYLTWTSDDNCYRPTAIAEMVALLESNPGVDIVYTDYTAIDEAGHHLGQVSAGVRADLVYGNSIGPCFLYRRSVQESLGGYAEDLFLAEDYDFWIRASVLFQFSPLHKDLYLYRRHRASLTDVHKAERVLPVAEHALSRSVSRMHWLTNELRAQAYLRLARGARRRNNATQALSYLLRALRCSPVVVARSGEAALMSAILASRGGKAAVVIYRKWRNLGRRLLGFRSQERTQTPR